MDTAAPDVEILAVEPPRVAVGAECLGSAGMRPVIVRIGDETGLGQAVAGWVYNGAQGFARLQAIHDQTFRGGPLSVRSAR